MLTLYPGRRFNPSGSIPNTQELAPYAAIPYILVNGVWVPRKPFSIRSGNLNGALAVSGALLLYDVTDGTLPCIARISFSGSIAGRYDVRYNSVAIDIINAQAGVTYYIEIPEGLLLTPTGALIDVVNNTAGVSVVYGSVQLAEYTI